MKEMRGREGGREREKERERESGREREREGKREGWWGEIYCLHTSERHHCGSSHVM